jgi:hypothetical protein
MLGTLLDSSGQSLIAFVREIASLLRVGLHTRATATARVGTRRLLADGLCYAGIYKISVVLAEGLTRPVTPPIPGQGVWSLALLGASLAIALIGYDRIAGFAALGWLASTHPGHVFEGHPEFVLVLAVTVACFTTMALAPRRGTQDIRRIAWLAVIVPLAVLLVRVAPSDILMILILPLPALAMLPTDPRPAIACALLCTQLGMAYASNALQAGIGVLPHGPLKLLAVAATPLVVVIATARTRSLRSIDSA